MAGLTEEDLDLLSHPTWAQPAIKDIYRKHGIKTSVPLEEAVQHIQSRAQMAQSLGVDAGISSGWANPEERAAAREKYAREGKTPGEVQKRWEESIYLLDPRTYQHMQRFGRDLDFLGSVQQHVEEGADKAAVPKGQWDQQADPTGIGDWKQIAKGYEAGAAQQAQQAATDLYERSKGNPLYRSSVGQANYQRYGGMLGGLSNATSNPDVPLGNYMTFSETVPNYLRMQGSGETDTSGESWERAQAARLATNRYRLASPSPIADMPAGASSQDIGRRIAELTKEVAASGVPSSDERWQRTTGWTPPGFVGDTLDGFISWADPTSLIPATKGVGALATSARAAAKGAGIAGRGWIKPIVQKAVSPSLSDLKWDAGIEQAVGHPLLGAAGGMTGRSWSQYGMGGGKPGEDFPYKTDEQVAEARQSGQAIYERLKDDDGVSRADDEAYNRLVASGVLPPTTSELHPRPAWRMHSGNKQ